ncbi:hypothetical protein OAF80_00720 [bacterium]|nr:hypothetical protein [bacterium]
MKKQYSILSVFAVLLISFSAMAGNGEYNLGSSDLKMPYFKPYKSIQSIQSITAADKGITEGGFFLHYNPFLPSKNYGDLKSAVITANVGESDEYVLDQTDVDNYRKELQDVGKFSIGHGLEIGNMFRLTDFEPMAIGLRLTWLDFGFAGYKASSDYSQYNIKGFMADIRAIKIGPYFTYALTDQMALDAFYQVAPTMLIGGFAGQYTDENDDVQTVGYPVLQYGLTHEIGVTYRFDILCIGIGYGMGNLRTIERPIPVEEDTYSIDGRAYVNTFRMMVGMKF